MRSASKAGRHSTEAGHTPARRGLRLAFRGAVLTAVVAAGVAWSSVDKTVTVVVDGQSRQIHTVASNVAAVLKEAGYVAQQHDIVAPSPEHSISNGQRVVLKRGRLLHLTIDGHRKDIWVTSPTVADALAELGYSSDNFTSVSRDKRLPLTPTAIEVRSPRSVQIDVDGKSVFVETTELTVAEMLADAGITVKPNQRVSVDVDSEPIDGQKVLVQTVTHKQITSTETVPFKVKSKNDPTLPKGSTQIVTRGRNGTSTITWDVVYVDGVEVGRSQTSSKPVRSPVDQVQLVGTADKAAIAAAIAAATPGSNRALGRELASARGWGDDQFVCLNKLWNRESGWQVNNVGPGGAYGIPQAVPGNKMGKFGSDWRTNPATQIKWGLSYVGGRYKTPCGAWSHSQATGWY